MHPDDPTQRVSHETICAAFYAHPRDDVLSRADEALEYRSAVCRSHAPWRRGSNENTNGLLRQFMPKGADLSTASQEYLNNVADLMNARPREALGGKTPDQALEEELAQFNSRVALAS